HLVGGDRVARLLEPGRDRRLGDAFAEIGNADVDGHASAPVDSASPTSASCSALWRDARPVAGEAAAARPTYRARRCLAPTRSRTHSRFGSMKVQAPWFFGSSWHQTTSAPLNRPSSLISDWAGNG